MEIDRYAADVEVEGDRVVLACEGEVRVEVVVLISLAIPHSSLYLNFDFLKYML